jgi:hypothetical protein
MLLAPSASHHRVRRFATHLGASLATLLLLVGCSGTKIPTGSDSATEAGAAGGGTGTGGDPGGGGNGGGGAAADAGLSNNGACPCALESYCDLTTNTCKPGCTDDAQCKPGRTCDLATRACKDKCSGAACGAQFCPAPKASGSCNGIVPDGAQLSTACKTGAAPMPKGGAITEGAYVLTSVEIYGAACTPSVVRGDVYICGSTWSFGFDQGGGTPSTGTATATAASATTYSVMQTCPALTPGTAPQVVGYDATTTTLVLYLTTGDSSMEVDHYSLR